MSVLGTSRPYSVYTGPFRLGGAGSRGAHGETRTLATVQYRGTIACGLYPAHDVDRQRPGCGRYGILHY